MIEKMFICKQWVFKPLQNTFIFFNLLLVLLKLKFVFLQPLSSDSSLKKHWENRKKIIFFFAV